MERKHITAEMVRYWVGSDAVMADVIQLLTDIAKGSYSAEQFAQDVISTNS